MAMLENIAVIWWQWMLPMSVQISALVLLIAVMDRILVRWAWPQLLAAIWAVAIIKLVVPPSVTLPVSVTQWGGDSLTTLSPLTANSESSSSLIVIIIFLVWLAGFSISAAWVIGRYHRIRQEWLAGASISHAEWFDAMIHRAAARLSLRRRPTVRLSPLVPGAAVVGFLRPVVVIPANLIQKNNRRQVEHVLMHEFAHIQRRDPMRSLLCLILRIVYWFHPLVWLALMRLSTLREVCCDHAVAARLATDTPLYRRTLIELAQPLLDRNTSVSLSFIHGHSQLMARLAWLARPVSAPRRSRGWVTFSAWAVLSICCVPMGTPTAMNTTDTETFSDLTQGCMRLRFEVFRRLAASNDGFQES